MLTDSSTDTVLNPAPSQHSVERVYDRGVRMLAHREHSAVELERKLKLEEER